MTEGWQKSGAGRQAGRQSEGRELVAPCHQRQCLPRTYVCRALWAGQPPTPTKLTSLKWKTQSTVTFYYLSIYPQHAWPSLMMVNNNRERIWLSTASFSYRCIGCVWGLTRWSSRPLGKQLIVFKACVCEIYTPRIGEDEANDHNMQPSWALDH